MRLNITNGTAVLWCLKTECLRKGAGIRAWNNKVSLDDLNEVEYQHNLQFHSTRATSLR